MNENKDTRLPPHLSDIQRQIEGYAREFGLDFYETIFEVLGYDEINMVAAYGGFPNRYPHWRFGMEYEQLSKGYEYGLSKIYEMVINNNPSYAYPASQGSHRRNHSRGQWLTISFMTRPR